MRIFVAARLADQLLCDRHCFVRINLDVAPPQLFQRHRGIHAFVQAARYLPTPRVNPRSLQRQITAGFAAELKLPLDESCSDCYSSPRCVLKRDSRPYAVPFERPARSNSTVPSAE